MSAHLSNVRPKPDKVLTLIADYATKWSNPYGLGEMSVTDTRNFSGGTFNVSAAPFRIGADFSVFDHLKYIAISTKTFPVPEDGSVEISSTIKAATPGTDPGRVIHGTYVESGLPYAEPTLESVKVYLTSSQPIKSFVPRRRNVLYATRVEDRFGKIYPVAGLVAAGLVTFDHGDGCAGQAEGVGDTGAHPPAAEHADAVVEGERNDRERDHEPRRIPATRHAVESSRRRVPLRLGDRRPVGHAVPVVDAE